MSKKLYRTILVADIVMLGLYPSIDWRGHLRRFLQDISTDLLEAEVRQPLTSQYTWFRLARAPMAAVDTMEWLMRRLPDLGRQGMRTLSAGERLIPHALRVLRRAVGIGIVAVVGLAVFTPDFSTEGSLGRLALRIEDNPWPWIGAGVLTVLLVNSFIRRMETS